MELLELGRLPISEEKPEGEDVRFEPEYEAIQNEIEKLSSPTAGGAPDWEKVKDASIQILSNKSKDLTVASYLSIALINTDKTNGIFPGVKILSDLLSNFWEDMFPPKKRIKGRVNAIAWWKEKMEAHILALEPVVTKKEEREKILNQFNAIDRFMEENLESAPPLRSLIDKVSAVLLEEQEASEQPQEVQEKSPEPEPIQETTPPPVDEDMDEKDSGQLLQKALDILGRATTLMSKENPYNPEIFRLNRICAWLTVDTLPIAEGGKTMLPPPDENIRSALKSLYDSQNWNALIESAESYVPQFLFWLDLSRYTAEALSGLNQSRAAKAVTNETLWYVEKLPGIEKLSFSDGSPFADEQTLEWLREMKSSKTPQELSSNINLGGKRDEIRTEALKEIQAKAKKDVSQALMEFKKQIESAPCVSEKFIWYIEICAFLLKIKKRHLILPYVDGILNLIEKYKLDEWDPDICVSALEVSLKGIRSIKRDENKEMEERILNKLSLLNPAVAVEFV